MDDHNANTTNVEALDNGKEENYDQITVDAEGISVTYENNFDEDTRNEDVGDVADNIDDPDRISGARLDTDDRTNHLRDNAEQVPSELVNYPVNADPVAVTPLQEAEVDDHAIDESVELAMGDIPDQSVNANCISITRSKLAEN